MPKKQFLLAHRGFSGIAPENTYLAFEMAYQFCFDGVELDVHLTKDHQIVIIHDEDTFRTAGVKKVIADTNLVDLTDDDHSHFFKIETKKQTILTLDEFLNAFLNKFQIINIELKTDMNEYPGIEEEVLKLAQKYNDEFYEKIIFSSFNFATLKRLHNLDKRFKLALLFWTKNQLLVTKKSEVQKICKFLHPWTKMYQKYPELIKEYNLPINLWTIKSKSDYDQFKDDENVYAQISNYQFEK